MQKAPIPNDEEKRLSILKKLGILDTPPEERFDEITKEATNYFKTPISTVSIIDKDREWFKSKVGIEKNEGTRDESFCGHALMADNVFVVNDTTKDERFSDNPQVVKPPNIRSYAGVVLREKNTKEPIGVFCIKDIKPRKFSTEDIAKLISLGQKAEEEINKKLS